MSSHYINFHYINMFVKCSLIAHCDRAKIYEILVFYERDEICSSLGVLEKIYTSFYIIVLFLILEILRKTDKIMSKFDGCL